MGRTLQCLLGGSWKNCCQKPIHWTDLPLASFKMRLLFPQSLRLGAGQVRVPDCFCSSSISMTSGSSNVTCATNSLARLAWLLVMSGLGHEKGTQGTAQKPRRQVLVYFCWSNRDCFVVGPALLSSLTPPQTSKTDRIELRHSHNRNFGPQVAAHHLGNVASCSACGKTCSIYNCTYVYVCI